MKFRNLIPFFVGTVIIVATTPIRSKALDLDLWVSFLAHFGASLFLFYRRSSRPWQVLLSYLAASLLFCIDFFMIDGSLYDKLRQTSLTNILPAIVAPLLAFWFYRSKASMRIAVGCIALICYFTNIFWLSEKWRNFQNWGVYSREVSEALPRGWVAQSIYYGNILTADSLNGKIAMLDFWNSGCGACIRSFPVLDSIYQTHKSDSRVRIQSIFIPYQKNDTPGHAEMIVAKKHAGFPIVAGAGLDSVFGIKVYPTVLLVYENRIIHRGSLESAAARLSELVKMN